MILMTGIRAVSDCDIDDDLSDLECAPKCRNLAREEALERSLASRM